MYDIDDDKERERLRQQQSSDDAVADNTRVKPSIINRELLIKRYLDEEHRPGVVRTSRHVPLGLQTFSPPDVRDFVEDVAHMTNRGTRYLLPWDWEKIHYAYTTFDYVKQLLIRERLKDHGWEQLAKAVAGNNLTHYNSNLELREYNEELPKNDRFETDVMELLGDGKELSTQQWSLIRRQYLLFGEGASRAAHKVAGPPLGKGRASRRGVLRGARARRPREVQRRAWRDPARAGAEGGDGTDHHELRRVQDATQAAG